MYWLVSVVLVSVLVSQCCTGELTGESVCSATQGCTGELTLVRPLYRFLETKAPRQIRYTEIDIIAQDHRFRSSYVIDWRKVFVTKVQKMLSVKNDMKQNVENDMQQSKVVPDDCNCKTESEDPYRSRSDVVAQDLRCSLPL